MGGYESGLFNEPQRPQADPWRLERAFEIDPLAMADNPEFVVCGDGPPTGPAAERARAEGQDRGRRITNNLAPSEWQFAIGYELLNFLYPANPPRTALTIQQRADAFLAGVNETLRTSNLEARFVPGEEGGHPRLVIRNTSTNLETEVPLPISFVEEGRAADRLSNTLSSLLQASRPPGTNATVRGAIRDAINTSFPPLPGENIEQRAARLQRLMPVLNLSLHQAGFHMEIGNDCQVRIYNWNNSLPRERRREGEPAIVPLAVPQDQAQQRDDARVREIIALPQLASAQTVRDMNPTERQELAQLVWQHYRQGGQDLISRLNAQFHSRGFHIEILPPGENAGRTDLMIYSWEGGRRGNAPLTPAIRLDQTVDGSVQHGTARRGFDAAFTLGILMERFAAQGERPEETVVRAVSHIFWETMRTVEGEVQGDDLTARRQEFVTRLRQALHVHGLDIEYDLQHPNTMQIFRWVNGARQGAGIRFDRPDQYAPPREDDPARPGAPSSPNEWGNGFFWGAASALVVYLAGRRALSMTRALGRWVFGERPVRPPGTDVSIPATSWRDLQRPFDDMRRLLSERGGFADGGAINRNAYDQRVADLIDSAINDAEQGRLRWSQAEIEAMRRFRTAYQGLRSGGEGAVTAEIQALNMMLENQRSPFQRTGVDYYNLNPEGLRTQTDSINRAFAGRTISGGLSSDGAVRGFTALFRTQSNTIFGATGETSFAQAQARARALETMARSFLGTPGLQIGIEPGQVVIEASSNVDGSGRQIVRHPGNSANPPIEGALIGREGGNVQIRLANGNVVTRPIAEIQLVIQLPETHLNHATGMTGEGSGTHTRMAANELASTVYRFLAHADVVLNGQAPPGATAESIGLHAETVARYLQLSLNGGRLTLMQNLGPVPVRGVDLARVISTTAPRGEIHLSVRNGVMHYELVDGRTRRALTTEEQERVERELREHHERVYNESIRYWDERARNERLTTEERQEARLVADALRADLNLYRTSTERRAEVHLNLSREVASPTRGGWRSRLGTGSRVLGSAVIVLILAETARHMFGGPGHGGGGIPVVPVTGGSG